ncbi:MAG: hypothetical protein M0P12_00085 [Paludibacteraceae bacterium]|nr:hypothetical protein [Paludibacteraceae bacterium]MCK9615753.1 hypothetical protein [Candidatus Omnitrophota bacterium]
MKVKYFCGCYTDSFPLFGEPDECFSEGEIEVDEEEWKDGSVTFRCPSCGHLLCQFEGHFYKG